MPSKSKIPKRKKRRKPSNTKWTEDFIWQAYALARTGMSDTTIGKALGFDTASMNRYKKNYPALVNAMSAGRKGMVLPGDSPVNSFHDFVLGRLPEHLQEIWTEIMDIDDERPGSVGLEEIDKLFHREPIRSRQMVFVHAFIHCNFNFRAACSKVGISEHTYRQWRIEDPGFAEICKVIHAAKKDFFESALCNLVAEHNPSAVIFANKTFNRDRGYAEKVEVNHTGRIEHNVNVVSIDDLSLPLETRRQILQAMKDRQNAIELKEDDAGTYSTESE